MKQITVAILRSQGACPEQVELFEKIFGESAELTEENWKLAQGSGLDVMWLVRLLDRPALAEYEKVEGAALAEYEKVEGAALAEYEKSRGAAWAEYEKVEGPALARCQKVRDAAWAEYKKVEGAALFKALKSMEEPA